MKSIPIAMLHHVEDRHDWGSLQPYCIKRKTLINLLTVIEKTGKRGVSLAEAIAKPSRKNVVLTFDDGAEHLWDFAIPELLKRSMTASFYIPTHHIGSTNSWDVKEGRSEVPLMSEEAIRELKNVGMDIGGHSHHHIRLADQEKTDIEEELSTSKKILDELLQQDTQAMAWPFGSVPQEASSLLKQAGWNIGLSIFSPVSKPSQLRRFIIHDGDTLRSIRLKCGPFYTAYRGIVDRRQAITSSRN